MISSTSEDNISREPQGSEDAWFNVAIIYPNSPRNLKMFGSMWLNPQKNI